MFKDVKGTDLETTHKTAHSVPQEKWAIDLNKKGNKCKSDSIFAAVQLQTGATFGVAPASNSIKAVSGLCVSLPL